MWGTNPAALTPAIWPSVAPLIRSDFKLFDEFIFSSPIMDVAGNSQSTCLASCPCPVTAVAASDDNVVRADMVAAWGSPVTMVRGPHLVVFDPDARAKWFDVIIDEVRSAAKL